MERTEDKDVRGTVKLEGYSILVSKDDAVLRYGCTPESREYNSSRRKLHRRISKE